MSHPTFYFHLSPWCPDYWEDKWNQYHLCSQTDLLLKQSSKGTERVQQTSGIQMTALTAHQIRVTCTVYTPSSGNQLFQSALISPAFPCTRDRQHPRPSQSHGQASFWDHSLGPGREKSLQEHPPSHSSPCCPSFGSNHQPGRKDPWESLGHPTCIQPSSILQCRKLRRWQSQPFLPCVLVLLNQLCKSGQRLGEVSELYLPKTLAFHTIKVTLKAWGHLCLSEVSRFSLLCVLKKRILYPWLQPITL